MSAILQFDETRSIPEQVAEWLDEAARTLAALPSQGLRPAGAGSTWPDYVRDLEDLDWAWESDERPPLPTGADVSRLDVVLTWPPMLDGANRHLRAVINMRLIVHPISGAHKWSWRKIGSKLNVSHVTAKAWHEEACAVIAKKIATGPISAFQTVHFAQFSTP